MEGLINTPSNIASYLESRNVGRGGVEDFIKGLHIPESNEPERALFGNEQEGDTALQGIGSFLPYSKIGGFRKRIRWRCQTRRCSRCLCCGSKSDPLQAALMGLGDREYTRRPTSCTSWYFFTVFTS